MGPALACLEENAVLGLVEGCLSDSARTSVEQHLAACDDCRAWVARAAEAVLSTGVASAGEEEDGAPQRLPRHGEWVGRYQVKEVLGSGAMGVVVAAHDTELDREVALKLLRRADSSDERKRFLREARLASAIRHSGIVSIHDVLTTQEGHPVLVMDRLHGETLRDLLTREAPLPVARSAELMTAVLSALAAAHERGIVHRDLKPENIFLAAPEGHPEATEREPRLLDFGIAKQAATDDKAGDLTHTGAIVGTPFYMAPEQAFGESQIDARADLWAVGVMLYECLTGTRPIAADSIGQMMKRLALNDWVPLAERRPRLPRHVTQLVDALLSPRDQRPSTAAEVMAALERCDEEGGRPNPARRIIVFAAAGGLSLIVASGLYRGSQTSPARVEAQPLTSRSPGARAAAPARPLLPKPIAATNPAATSEGPRPKPPPTAATGTAGRPPSAKPSASSKPQAPSVGPGKLLTQPPF